jgi:hypothetical protein
MATIREMTMKRARYALWITGCLVIALFCLIYPIYVIRPFRHQGAGELAVALAVLRFRPAALAICVAIAIAAAALYWRVQPRIWRRIGAVVGVAGVCMSAALSRVNVYELMFHPIGQPAFAPIGQTKLDGDEKVLAIGLAGAARAYPVRIISYHHVVNDVLGGVPIVATY